MEKCYIEKCESLMDDGYCMINKPSEICTNMVKQPLISETNEGAEVPCNVGLSCRELIEYWRFRARGLREEPTSQVAKIAAIELESCADNLAKALDGKETEASGFEAR